MKRFWILGVVAVLLVAAFAIGGCVPVAGPAGPQGEQGEAGPPGECDCDVAASNATFVIVATDCPDFEDKILVFGSGFAAEETVTLYFWGEDKDTQVKWCKVDTNEVGAFAVEEAIPTYSEFNEDILKDVSADEDMPCYEGVALTVGAYVDGDCVATFPLILPAEAD